MQRWAALHYSVFTLSSQPRQCTKQPQLWWNLPKLLMLSTTPACWSRASTWGNQGGRSQSCASQDWHSHQPATLHCMMQHPEVSQLWGLHCSFCLFRSNTYELAELWLLAVGQSKRVQARTVEATNATFISQVLASRSCTAYAKQY